MKFSFWIISLLSLTMLVGMAEYSSNNEPSFRTKNAEENQKACSDYSGLPNGFAKQPQAGMVKIPGGSFTPGSEQGYVDELPTGAVDVDAFWIDRSEVTNAQFAAFVEATGYITEAEHQGGAAVFKAPAAGASLSDSGWWHYTPGADWRHPEGPASDLEGRHSEPVVLVTLADAQAYAGWLGRELPSEAQWEWAAIGGAETERLQREPRDSTGKTIANYWQGVFPYLNTEEDGYLQRSPVGCYPPNGYGLSDMIGNVWEWTVDAYQGQRQIHGNGDPAAGNETAYAGQPLKVIKGGSFLCARDYCVRYRSSARHPQEANLGVSHVGFRTVLNSKIGRLN